MNRLILLVMLGVCVWYYFPETRGLLRDAAAPVLVPIATWSVREEMSQIGRNVVEHERLTGQLPGGWQQCPSPARWRWVSSGWWR